MARPEQPVSPVEAGRASRADVPRPDARPQRPMVAPRVAEPVRPEGPTAPRPHRARPARTTTAGARKAGHIPRPSLHRRCSRETQPRLGTTRTSSAPGSSSASRPHRRRIVPRRCVLRSSVSRSGSRKTGPSRRSDWLIAPELPVSKRGAGNFFGRQQTIAPDRLLGTGNLKPGTGS